MQNKVPKDPILKDTYQDYFYRKDSATGYTIAARNDTLHRLISLCGVNSYKTPISPRIFERGPAFKESVSILNESQARAIKTRVRHITSITARYDQTVPIKSNVIPGARRVTVWSMGHLTTIVLCLSILSFIPICEVRRKI